MSERSLRNRTIIDYSAMHCGSKGKISAQKGDLEPEKQLDMSSHDTVPDIAQELEALEKEEKRLRLEIALAEKKRQISDLHFQLQQTGDTVKDNSALDVMLKKNAKELSTPAAVKQTRTLQTPSLEKKAEVSLKDLSKNKDLEAALYLLKGSHLDFLDNQQNTSRTDNQQIQGKLPLKPLYLIPDFVSKPNASASNSSDRDKAKKVEDITAAQWISANSKILLKLVADGMDQDEVQQYLKYTGKVGDYLQMAEVSSVMLLDNEHRRQVHEEGRQWDNIDSDKVYFFLKAQSAQPSFKQKFKQQATDENGRPICIRFNKGICHMSFCKYSHVCLICKGDHPKMQHGLGQNSGLPPSQPPSQPPRFRQY